MKVHVCEVIKTLDVGGAEVLLVERLLAAPSTGKRYTVVCLRASTDELVQRLRSAGIHVVDLTTCPRALRLARFLGVVRRLQPDVLNNHSPLPASLLRAASRLSDAPARTDLDRAQRALPPANDVDRPGDGMDGHPDCGGLPAGGACRHKLGRP